MTAEPRLTLREWSVAERVARGMSRDEIAEDLGLSPNTVRPVIRRLCLLYDCNAQELPFMIGIRGLGTVET
jgi:DNA-binding NarL/FixJ family response regulator